MNKVITIHLHGVAFQLEEGGYDALRTYLDQAERQLAANPDKTEILADIEQAIGDKFRALLNANRNVVLATEVAAVIAEIGPVTDSTSTGADAEPKPDSQPGAGANTQGTGAGAAPPKRLYRITDGAIVRGVCNGLAAYLGIDVALVRLATVLLTFVSFGAVALAYLVAVIIVPEANTPEEKAAAAGPSPTAQEFIRKAREGYYEGLKAFPNREARREWKRKFRHEMRALKYSCQREMRWHPQWGPPSSAVPPPPAYQVVLPILATLKALLFFVCALAILSLLSTGLVFGVTLPGHLPIWAAVVVLLLAYNVVVAPVKALRRTYYARLHGWPACWNPLTEACQGLLGFLVLALGLWMADRFVPGFHEVLLNVPVFLHNAADAVQQWWAGARLEK